VATEETSDIERRVREAVATLGAQCEELPCAPDFADTAAFCERYGVDPADSANAILVASSRPPGRFAVCVLLATTRLDVNRSVCGLLEVRRASFATAEQTREITGMMIGGVTPFGLPGDLPIYVDARVMTRASVVIGGGSRSLKLRCAPAELRKIAALAVIDGLAGDRNAPPVERPA
jgi:prolyl-tRNA editing enzyme YbaK/EbsC (Cys-tRNA(Pro) deacylase)